MDVGVSASSARIFSLIAGKKTRQTRGYVDQVAAQIILQNYLDRRFVEKPSSPCMSCRAGSRHL
jgi:RNase H-fold protein (predicted Holliday junction resolvase)